MVPVAQISRCRRRQPLSSRTSGYRASRACRFAACCARSRPPPSVPVILRGERDDPKSRFWAERAGAVAYVAKGRMGDLVRALAKATAAVRTGDGFFMQLPSGSMDIRDRIAQNLDAALFDSVIASEVRALANAGEFHHLFDQLSQVLSQLNAYRWLALSTPSPEHFGLHCHPKLGEQAEREARAALSVSDALRVLSVQDEDALHLTVECEPIVCVIRFANTVVGTVALSPSPSDADDAHRLLPLVARELGGALRMSALVEETQRQASIDMLTGLMNRRAFLPAIRGEVARSRRYGLRLSVLLIDIDHFKVINDRYGHAAGDQVLSSVGRLLTQTQRNTDFAARWGGEEFVIALTCTDVEGGRVAAERVRASIEGLTVRQRQRRADPCHGVGGTGIVAARRERGAADGSRRPRHVRGQVRRTQPCRGRRTGQPARRPGRSSAETGRELPAVRTAWSQAPVLSGRQTEAVTDGAAARAPGVTVSSALLQSWSWCA